VATARCTCRRAAFVQEAATLKQQYDNLNEVLEHADVRAMLAAHTTMKKSMEALIKVPEFSGVADKVSLLESRLRELAVPKLASAITNRNGAVVSLSELSTWSRAALMRK
jgi:hypothetical protein